MSSDQLPLSPRPSPKPQGIPMWIALVVLLVLMVIVGAAFGGFWYYVHNDKLKLQRQLEAAEAQKQRADLEQKKAAEDAKLALARNQQEQVLAQVRAATNVLMKLVADADRLRGDAVGLRTNETGRAVALHPELVPLARRFYESSLHDFPPEEE